MARRTSPLPRWVEGSPEESGSGFLLRSLVANDMDMEDFRAWLGLPRSAFASRQQVRVLAWATGADPSWLANRFIARSVVDGKPYASLLGHTFRPSMLARDRWVQFCPECLHERGICKCAWDIACVCYCDRHGLPLIDECFQCHRRVEWARPDIDVCQCGHRLVRPAASGVIESEHVRTWSAWAEARLNDSGVAGITVPPCLPPWFSFLSIDGAFRILHAFGAVSDNGRVHRSPAVPSVPSMISMLDRGITRLSALLSEGRSARDMDIVHMPALTRLAEIGICPADRAAAERLIHLTTRARPSGRSCDLRGLARQLSLFDGGAL